MIFLFHWHTIFTHAEYADNYTSGISQCEGIYNDPRQHVLRTLNVDHFVRAKLLGMFQSDRLYIGMKIYDKW